MPRGNYYSSDETLAAIGPTRVMSRPEPEMRDDEYASDREMTPWEQARHEQKNALGELHDAISEMGVRLRPASCERVEKMQDDPRIAVAHSELVTDMYAVTDGMRAASARLRELTSSLDL